jgi:hypothetical protein
MWRKATTAVTTIITIITKKKHTHRTMGVFLVYFSAKPSLKAQPTFSPSTR